MARITIKTVNKMLAQNDIAERLVKGKDYFYFSDGNAHTWPDTMVCVMRLNQLDLVGWFKAHQELAKAARDRG